MPFFGKVLHPVRTLSKGRMTRTHTKGETLKTRRRREKSETMRRKAEWYFYFYVFHEFLRTGDPNSPRTVTGFKGVDAVHRAFIVMVYKGEEWKK